MSLFHVSTAEIHVGDLESGNKISAILELIYSIHWFTSLG